MTLSCFSGATYLLGRWIEPIYIRYRKRSKTFHTIEQTRNQLFVIATFIAFNLLFFLGVSPTLGWLPQFMQPLVSWLAVLISSLWLAKTWRLSAIRYARERDGNFLRRQLTKLNIDLSPFLEGRSLNELNPDELYALAKVLPNFSHQYRLQLYSGVVKEALERRSVGASSSLRNFQGLRQELGIHDAEHTMVLDQILHAHPDLAHPRLYDLSDTDQTVRRSQAPQSTEQTIARTGQHPFQETLHILSRSRASTADPISRPASGDNALDSDPTVVRPFIQDPANLDPTVARPSQKKSANSSAQPSSQE